MKSLKFCILICFIVCLLPLGTSTCAYRRTEVGAGKDSATVGIVQIVDDEVMAECRRGFMDTLKERSPAIGKSMDVQWTSARDQTLALKPILLSYVREEKDLIVTFGSASLERAVAVVDNTPVVFGVTINPTVLGLNIKHRGSMPNFTGSYSEPPMQELGELMHRIMPNLKVVGTIWDPSEINSRYEMHFLRQTCEEYGFRLRESRARKSQDLKGTIEILLDLEPEAIVILADNSVLKGLDVIAPIIKEKRIPIFTDIPAIVKEGGADLGWGFDFYEWGKTTGRLALEVLSGTKPSKVPVEEFKKVRMSVNPKAFAALNLSLPSDILERADTVLQ